MTLGDLLKRVDIGEDRDKMFILRDGNGGWTNVSFAVKDNEISIIPDVAMPFVSDDLHQIPDAPPYKIGDEDYRDRVGDQEYRSRVTCETYSPYLRDNGADWSLIR